MVDADRIWWDPTPNMNRRSFLRDTLAFAGAAAGASCARTNTQPKPFADLTPMTVDVTPIADDERQARIERARQLMRDRGLDAMFLESGSSLFYYTGEVGRASCRARG